MVVHTGADSTITPHNYMLLSFTDLPPRDLSPIDIVAVGDNCGNDYRGQSTSKLQISLHS
jgi:hypothetical protein